MASFCRRSVLLCEKRAVRQIAFRDPGRTSPSPWQLTDILGQNVFERDGGELASPGLFVDLGPWQFRLFALQ